MAAESRCFHVLLSISVWKIPAHHCPSVLTDYFLFCFLLPAVNLIISIFSALSLHSKLTFFSTPASLLFKIFLLVVYVLISIVFLWSLSLFLSLSPYLSIFLALSLSHSSCPVGWGCRIHQLLHCRGARPPQRVSGHENNLIMRFQ